MFTRYIVFFVWLIGSVVVSFLIGTPEVFSFNRFKVWTVQQNLKIGHGEYLEGTLTDDTSVALALANIRVANGVYHTDPSIARVFSLVKEAVALSSIDVMSLLSDDEENKRNNLETHIRHLVLNVEESRTIADILFSQAESLMTEAESCLTNKRAGDKQFFDGLVAKQDAEVQQGLSQSLEHAPCYITKRIEANAYAYLSSYLSAIVPFLTQRATVLSVSKEQLLTYHGLLEGDTLNQLQVLKQQLFQINTPIALNDAESVFSLWMITDKTVFPTYNGVFFAPWGTPSYQDPIIGLRNQSN